MRRAGRLPAITSFSVGVGGRVDGAGVSPAVNRGNLPRAPADTAEAPSARTAVSLRERSRAFRASAASFRQLVCGKGIVEHLFGRS